VVHPSLGKGLLIYVGLSRLFLLCFSLNLSNPKIAKKIMPPITNTIPQINSILSMFDEPETWKQPNNPKIFPHIKKLEKGI